MATLDVTVDVCIYLHVHLFQILFKDIISGDQLLSSLQGARSTIPRKYCNF